MAKRQTFNFATIVPWTIRATDPLTVTRKINEEMVGLDIGAGSKPCSWWWWLSSYDFCYFYHVYLATSSIYLFTPSFTYRI